MTAVNITVKRRMLKRIRIEIALAENKASSLRENPDLRAYAYLFNNAVRFWGDVNHTVTNNREPDSREQAFVIDKLRGNTLPAAQDRAK